MSQRQVAKSLPSKAFVATTPKINKFRYTQKKLITKHKTIVTHSCVSIPSFKTPQHDECPFSTTFVSFFFFTKYDKIH
jgi:hypothetical protein